MDSLTQIVLGAAVGEAVLGKKVGNRAMLWGAVAGTIPDLDIVSRYFVDVVTATEWHRGISHSIFFALCFAPLFGWLVWRLYRKQQATWQGWSLLFFWCMFTHPLLDAFTTWGTQLFWPLDLRLAFQNIFVIDPLYTLPFLVCLLLAMRQKRDAPLRAKYLRTGLLLSSFYLVLTLVFKGFAHQKFTAALQEQGILHQAMDTRPAPLNSILWMANVDTPEAYLIGDYSFFDTQPITFAPVPKNHELLGPLAAHDKVKRLIAISEGWYAITQKEGRLFFNDLRFGMLSLDAGEEQFAFSYELQPTANGVLVTEVPKFRGDAKRLLAALWDRIWGN
ncbi:metal-dependent hydrolase [Maribacter sp. 2307ULW6-5]|uniref:metal-dependent hydrolase n=1 Tax=Maribacter sp. 2307ULW6-5 TaxID=3386275 RepID=UPI0039BD5B10